MHSSNVDMEFEDRRSINTPNKKTKAKKTKKIF